MERIERRDYVARAHRYARAVVSGEQIACKWVKAACQRHLDDLERQKTAKWPYRFDEEKAKRPCVLLELMPHVKAFKGTIRAEDFQLFILASLFGWVRKDDGLRRFRQGYCEMARKNAKSTLSAVIGLFLLALDGEAGPEVYSAATTRDQARIVFEAAQGMCAKSERLRTDFQLEPGKQAIVSMPNGGTFKALSSDAHTLDGLNIHGAIVDELHAHPTRAVWDVLASALGSRKQPLIWAITTAGSDRGGICYEVRDYAARVLNSTLQAHDGMGYKVEGSADVDDTFFGLIYTIDDEDDWTDEGCWVKANPNLGVSVSIEYLRQEVKRAQAIPSQRSNVLTKHFDVWVNADQAWMDMQKWAAAGNPALELEQFEGQTVYLGLDLAFKNDLCALAILIPDGRKVTAFTRSYLPSARAEINERFTGWQLEGKLRVTDGSTIDFDQIYDEIVELTRSFDVAALAYDPAHAAYFVKRLENDGTFREDQLIEIPQNARGLSEPMKEIERRVLDGDLEHDGDPCLTWQVSNVVAKIDAGNNMRPTKDGDGKKIDAAVAVITAAGAMLRLEQESNYLFWRAS